MRRYYSHYTFIYPDVYLKNFIVEVDDESRILQLFPFDREIERTEFYSGLLSFIPLGVLANVDYKIQMGKASFGGVDSFMVPTVERYKVIHDENGAL